jgi:putative DNA primase/helicase
MIAPVASSIARSTRITPLPRSMHFEFTPGFKIWLVTNHRPRVQGDDDAIWRRLRLIPFEVSFRGREDKTLGGKLHAELPGILAWAVQGCREWQREGLPECAAVTAATQEYRADEDLLGAFLAERCDLTGWVEAADLRVAYVDFCKSLGERPLATSALGRRLKERGITRTRVERDVWAYQGVSLRA